MTSNEKVEQEINETSLSASTTTTNYNPAIRSYIADMLSELAIMARQNGMISSSYFINAAYMTVAENGEDEILDEGL